MPRPRMILAAAALAGVTALAPLTSAVAEPAPGGGTPAPTASASSTPAPSPTLAPGPSDTPHPIVPGSSVLVYPANPVAAPGNPAHASAVWVNGSLRITYDWTVFKDFPRGASDAGVVVSVDGVPVYGVDESGDADQVVTVPRAAWAGPAHVVIESVGYIERGSWYDYEYAWLFEATVSHRTVPARAGQVPAQTLLDRLPTAKERSAASYRASRFPRWIDADRDHESTRTEVLKAESTTKVTRNRHRAVVAGRWVSPYDGAVLTRASQVDVDTLVPLQEAWTSGAASWSARKRTAYANDLGYGPSLAAVSKAAHRAKGDREPNAYLPSATGSICPYLRSWVAVKYRWGLSVDATERRVLTAGLARCVHPFVTKPGKPDVRRLAGR